MAPRGANSTAIEGLNQHKRESANSSLDLSSTYLVLRDLAYSVQFFTTSCRGGATERLRELVKEKTTLARLDCAAIPQDRAFVHLLGRY